MRKVNSVKYVPVNIRFMTSGSDGYYPILSSGSLFSKNYYSAFRLLVLLSTSDLDHYSWWLFEVRLKVASSGLSFLLDYDLLDSYNYYGYAVPVIGADPYSFLLSVRLWGNFDGPNIITSLIA